MGFLLGFLKPTDPITIDPNFQRDIQLACDFLTYAQHHCWWVRNPMNPVEQT